jgi:hypothetical protein
MILVMAFALTVAACDSQPTLDFSSDESAVKSLQVISKELSIEDQQRFKATMSKIITSITNETFSKSENMSEAYPLIKNRIHEVLNKKTAEEIIALGEAIQEAVRE